MLAEWLDAGVVRRCFRGRGGATAFLLLLANLAIFAWFCSRRPLASATEGVGGDTALRAVEDGPYRGHRQHRERIDKIIREVAAESPEALEAGLLDEFLYMYPGVRTANLLPQVDLQKVLSNRRAVRLLSIIEALPPEARTAKCSALLTSLLEAHTQAIDRIIAHAKDPEMPKNEQSLGATSCAIGMTLYASAEFCDAKHVISALDRLWILEKQLKPRIEPDEELPLGIRGMLKRYYIPDNFLQLNVLLIAASHAPHPSANLPSVVAATKKRCVKRNLTLVPFDADVTEFDIPHLVEGIPIDTSKGSRDVILYDWPSDIPYSNFKAQRAMISALRDALALSGGGVK